MNGKMRVLLPLALAAGSAVVLLLYSRWLFDGKLYTARTTDMDSAPAAPAAQRYSTSEEMLYILYGDAHRSSDFSQHNGHLIEYVRSYISQPSPRISRSLAMANKTEASQCGQSRYVDKLLSGRRGGFFVECGAADGETLSNSLFFEVERNWTGLLIEANPDFHHALLSKNRNAYVLRACLSTERRPMTVRMQPAEFLSRIDGQIDDSRRSFSVSKKKPEVLVNCFPLNTIMAALNITHVDYMSLDVEGPEIEILRSVDWTRLRIDVITVEYRVLVGDKVHHHLNKLETLRKLRGLRKLFSETGIYREVGRLPGGSELAGLDVVFSRIRNSAAGRS